MNEDRPILSYASGTIGPLSSDAQSFLFRPPSFAVGLVFNSLVACFFVGAAVAIALRVSTAPQVRWDRVPVVLSILFGACAVFGWQHWRRARHLIRFGGLPVKITIDGGQIILIDPPQWGLKVETVALNEITDCDAAFVGWSLFGPTIYRITIYLRDRDPLELRASSKEAATVDQAVAAITSRLPLWHVAE